MNAEEKASQRFAPLAEVKLSNEDKSDILRNLRAEMARERQTATPLRRPRRSKHHWTRKGLLVGGTAAASIAIVTALVLSSWYNGNKGGTKNPINPFVETAYAYTYTKIAPPVFNCLQMPSAKSGWGWGYGKDGRFQLIHTMDGGTSWAKVALSTQPPVYDISVNQIGMPGYVRPYFLDDNTGWLSWIDGSTLSVMQTTDGGNHWTVSHMQMPEYAKTVANIRFINPSKGWLVAVSAAGMGQERKFLYQTENGGKSWTLMAQSPDNLPAQGTSTDITFAPNGMDGWFATASPLSTGAAVYRTNDGGKSWNSVPLPAPTGFEQFNVVDESIPVFNGADGVMTITFSGMNVNHLVIYHSVDGGQTWKPSTLPGEGWMNPTFVDNQHGFIVRHTSEGCEIFGSTDGGSEWSKLASIQQSTLQKYPYVGAMRFVNQTTGWMVLQSPDFTQSILLKTEDGGKTWRSQ